MKNCILTPTYEGHFKYIKEYLESYKKYCGESKNTIITFVLSDKVEKTQFEERFAEYISTMPIEIYDVEAIFKEYGVNETSKDLLKKYGHTSYQTLKKVYSMLYINAERFLVLDSESSWIANTNMDKEFDDFFESPYLIVSKSSSRTITDSFLSQHFAIADYLFGRRLEVMPFEHFMWYYTKEIISKMCADQGFPMKVVERIYDWEIKNFTKPVGLMEVMWIQTYIYDNAKIFSYTIKYTEDMLNSYVKNSERFIQNFFEYNRGGNIGILEFPCMMLNKKNADSLIKLYREQHINIIRCDETTIFNRKLEEDFLRDAKIKILAVSQEHGFLTTESKNAKRKKMFVQSRKFLIKNFKKRIKRVINR